MAAQAIQKAKKSKKQRKHGRGNRIGGQCQVYKASHRRERNKLRRLNKHLVRFDADKVAENAVKACKIALGIR